MPAPEEKVPLREAAHRLRVMTAHARNLVIDDILHGEKLAGQWWVTVASIEERLRTVKNELATQRRPVPGEVVTVAPTKKYAYDTSKRTSTNATAAA